MPSKTKRQQRAAKRALDAKQGKRNPKFLRKGSKDMHKRLTTQGLEYFASGVAEGEIPTAPDDLRKLIDQFERSEIEMGMDIEQEHNGGKNLDVSRSPLDTLKIVLAHMKEDPKYYTHLKAMEREHGVNESTTFGKLKVGDSFRYNDEDRDSYTKTGTHKCKDYKGKSYHEDPDVDVVKLDENSYAYGIALKGIKSALGNGGGGLGGGDIFGRSKGRDLARAGIATDEDIAIATKLGASAHERGVSKPERDKELKKAHEKIKKWDQGGNARWFGMRSAWIRAYNDSHRGVRESTTSTSSFEYDKSPTDSYKAPELNPTHFSQEDEFKSIADPDPQYTDKARSRTEGDEKKTKSDAKNLLWDEDGDEMGVDEVRSFLRPNTMINYGSSTYRVQRVTESHVELMGRNGVGVVLEIGDILGIQNNTIITEIDEDRLGEVLVRMIRAMKHQ